MNERENITIDLSYAEAGYLFSQLSVRAELEGEDGHAQVLAERIQKAIDKELQS